MSAGDSVLAAWRESFGRALLPSPLMPDDDPTRFGCHAIAGLPAEPDALRRAKPAAVLVGVMARAESLSILLTERAAHLSAHAGQVAFPGGRIEPGEGEAEAALREAQEEVGLDPAHVTPLGFLPPYFSGTGYRVQPMVGLVDPAATLRPDPSEVARIFEVPLAVVLDPQRYRSGTIYFRGKDRRFYVLDTPEAYIWGVTAGILKSLADRCG